MENITVQQRKRMILMNQHITEKTKPEEVCHDLCGIQAQFYNHALHSLRIRSCEPLKDLDITFYKTWALRGTLHLITREDHALFLSAMQPHYKDHGHYYTQFFTEKERQELCSLILEEARAGRGNRRAFADVMAQRGYPKEKIETACSGWGGLYSLLSVEGKLVFKDITSRDFVCCKEVQQVEASQAREEIILRYFQAYGPADIRDAAYFLHWSQKEIRTVIEKHELHCYKCSDRILYGGREIEDEKRLPSVVFLGGFDPLMLGYEKHQNPFLPKEYLRKIFNLQGIVFAGILLKGEICGKWKKDKKRVVCELFRELNTKECSLIEKEANRLWKGQVTELIWKKIETT